MKKYFHHPFFIRLFNWEYWDSRVVYAPLYPYYAWLSVKAGSFMFFSAANPRIRNGGFIMESKRDVYDLLPKGYYPVTLYYEPGTAMSTVLADIVAAGINFPLIAKPDIGERGLAVKKIDRHEELAEYILHMPVAFLIQEFISYPHEVGIFYCKMPHAQHGCISGIVNKEPVCITGNGTDTIAELVRSNERYLLQWAQIQHMHAHRLHEVLPAGVRLVLVPYGNHSRGSKFTDETFRVTEKLTTAIDRICAQMPEFYYGRLDIRFSSWEALEVGEDFSIIEVNGSGSEPTHIYDPAHSIFYAWKEIIRHWDILYSISKANNKKGVSYTSMFKMKEEMGKFKTIEALLSARIW